MKTKLNLFILLIAGSIFANNYYVAPNGKNISPYSTWENAALNIKDAVALANNGDAVIISNGAYTIDEHIVIDKPITVKSLNGFEETLIDCNHNSRAFLVTADNTVIDGITIEKGNTYTNSAENRGGAIYLDCDMASIINSSFITNFGSLGGAIFAKADSIISNCVFKYNRASISGGGAIYTYHNNSRVNIVDCDFSYNWCLGWGGGAIIAWDETKISNCKIFNNRSADFGGGVNLHDYSVIENSLIYNNFCEQSGGGINAQWRSGEAVPSVLNCIVSNNTAIYTGGGIYCQKEVIVKNSIICYNSADQGGGIGSVYSASHRADSLIENCKIINNTANDGGGYMSPWFGILKNCLIANNTARTNGGGATLWYKGALINCTIVNNNCETPGNSDGVYLYNDSGYTAGQSDISNCIIYSNGEINYENVDDRATFNLTCTFPEFPTGTGNITNNPLFIDKAANNYKLMAVSPCVNAGNNIDWMFNAKDLAGNARVLDEIVDMGAYETALGLWCDFAADKLSVLPDSEVIFSSNVQGTNVINLVYDWNFLAIGENLSIVTNTYITEGLYDVSLTVSNNVGETYTCSKLDYIEVVPEPSLFLIFNLLVIYWHRKLIFIK